MHLLTVTSPASSCSAAMLQDAPHAHSTSPLQLSKGDQACSVRSGGHLCPSAAQHALCKRGRWWSDSPCCAGEALRAATCAGPARPRAQASPRIEAGTSVPCQPVRGGPGSRDAASPSSRHAPGDLQPQGELHASSQPWEGPVP